MFRGIENKTPISLHRIPAIPRTEILFATVFVCSDKIYLLLSGGAQYLCQAERVNKMNMGSSSSLPKSIRKERIIFWGNA